MAQRHSDCLIYDLRDSETYMTRLAAISKKGPLLPHIFAWLKQRPESLIMLQDLRNAR